MRAAFAAILLAAAARAAAAAPLAQADLAVDGRTAKIAVEPSGEVTADGATISAAAPHASALSATLEAQDVAGTPTVLATITTPAGPQAIVLEHRGVWKQILAVPLGGAGLDDDFGTALALTRAGVVRYQTRPGFRRCDGKPAYFFAEGWTGAKFQRLARVPTEVDPSAPVLAARPDPDAAPAPLLYQARVASREPGADDIGGLGVPRALDDGKPDTAWAQDFPASNGEGQFFTFEARSGAKAVALRFVEAPAAGGARANRPKRLALVGAGAAYHVDLPDAPPGAAFVVDLPQPIGGCVTAILESAYGAPRGTTAIGELEIFADGERAGGGGEAVLAALVASGADGAQSAAQTLAHRGAAAVSALAAALAQAKDAAARGRIVQALIATGDPAAAAAIRGAIGSLRDEDKASAIAALGALGQVAMLAELADDHDLGADGRVAAVRALDHALASGGPAAQRAALLVPLAGKGPAELRRAVIDALVAVPAGDLVAAANGAHVAAASGDLWRAVARRGHSIEAERAAAVAAMLAALPAATDYERRYRLVEGLAALGDQAALGAIDALLRSLGPQAAGERAALAQVAAAALAAAPRPDASAFAIALAGDPDPGVRLAALVAVGATSDEAGGDRILGRALESDPWPELRSRAAQVLGGRCARSGPAHALALSLGRDPELDVRTDALVALVQCKATGTGALLAKVWSDGKQPLALRRHAVELAIPLGDPALGPELVRRLAAWRGAASDSADALALAQSAAYAVGRLAPPGAADALLAVLGDSAYPELVAAAASGLGMLGPACPATARAPLRALASNEEQQIALAAGRALAQCGAPIK